MALNQMTRTKGQAAVDARGDLVENLSVENWRTKMISVTSAAWVEVTVDGAPRNHLLVNTSDSNTAKVILAQSNLSAVVSNDLTASTCGLPLKPDASLPLQFTENVKVYARMQTGGADGKLYIAEAL